LPEQIAFQQDCYALNCNTFRSITSRSAALVAVAALLASSFISATNSVSVLFALDAEGIYDQFGSPLLYDVISFNR
jgi:hypothetical protein